MKFWNDELRVCPKCRAVVQMPDEPRTECPKCHAPVWFFSYRTLPSPPELPEPRPTSLWKHPLSVLLLATTGILALAALGAVRHQLLVSAVSALAAMGFAAFGFVRHAEAKEIEERLEHSGRIRRYAETMRGRVKELTARYNHLLRTDDARIEHYYETIYARAAEERNRAEDARNQAARDRAAIASVEQRIYSMAERLIQDHLKWTAQKLRPDPENYQRRKLDLEKAFTFVEGIGYQLPANLRRDALARLKDDYKRIVREYNLKEQQKRINQQMREEEKLRRERERELRETEDRERDLQRRLERALREHRGVFDAEVEELRRQLAEAQAQSERAKSMAQLTKAGHVYILSNIGSFGEGVYKVGVTRRLEPQDRVKELGDASVPFPFDVHAMISCDNAPRLENALHHELTRHRVNRVNLRKEYFRIDLDTILGIVRVHHGEIEYVAEPEALEYRDSLNISPDDLVEIESELAEMGVDIEEEDE